MRAKQFYKVWISTIKAPTSRKIKNLARKVGLKDNFSEILFYTNLTKDEASEFII